MSCLFQDQFRIAHYISLSQLSVGLFLSLPLFFMTLMLLKKNKSGICKMSLDLRLSDFFLWLDWDYGFWGVKLPLSVHPVKGYVRSLWLITGVVDLDRLTKSGYSPVLLLFVPFHTPFVMNWMLCPPQFLCWTPKPQVMVLGSESLLEVITSWGWNPHEWD